MPSDAEELLDEGTRCDLMLVDMPSERFKQEGALIFMESDPRVLFYSRPR